MSTIFDPRTNTYITSPEGFEEDAMLAYNTAWQNHNRNQLLFRGLSGIGREIASLSDFGGYTPTKVTPALALAMGPEGVAQVYDRNLKREALHEEKVAQRERLRQQRQQTQIQQQFMQQRAVDAQKDRDTAEKDRRQRILEADRNFEMRDAEFQLRKEESKRPAVSFNAALGGWVTTHPDGTYSFVPDEAAIQRQQEISDAAFKRQQAIFEMRQGVGGEGAAGVGVGDAEASVPGADFIHPDFGPVTWRYRGGKIGHDLFLLNQGKWLSDLQQAPAVEAAVPRPTLEEIARLIPDGWTQNERKSNFARLAFGYGYDPQTIEEAAIALGIYDDRAWFGAGEQVHAQEILSGVTPGALVSGGPVAPIAPVAPVAPAVPEGAVAPVIPAVPATPVVPVAVDLSATHYLNGRPVHLFEDGTIVFLDGKGE